MFSCARTAILWGAFLFLMLGCTRSTHALNVHADSELLAEKPELCFKPPTDSHKYCCSCESLHEAMSKARETLHRLSKTIIDCAWHPDKISKEECRKVRMTGDWAGKGFVAVKQCLEDFKKKSCTVPVAPCHFTTGDGTGGPETRVTTTSSAAACATYVRQHRPLANGATWGANSHECYAEFQMTGQNSNTAYRTCSFPSGFGRRLLLDLPDNDEFRLDEGVADMQLTKPVQDGLDSQLNELQAEYVTYRKFCSAW